MALNLSVHDAWNRGLRTFETTAIPILGAALLVFQAGHATGSDATRFALGLAVALLAGLSAFVMAVLPVASATSALGMAIATALQAFGAGLVVLKITDLSAASGIAFAHALVYLIGASLMAGLLNYVHHGGGA